MALQRHLHGISGRVDGLRQLGFESDAELAEALFEAAPQGPADLFDILAEQLASLLLKTPDRAPAPEVFGQQFSRQALPDGIHVGDEQVGVPARQAQFGVGLSGNRSLYSPLISPRRARAAAVADLVATAFGGAPAPAVQMMIEEEELEPEERQDLRRRLEELDGPSDDSDGASER